MDPCPARRAARPRDASRPTLAALLLAAAPAVRAQGAPNTPVAHALAAPAADGAVPAHSGAAAGDSATPRADTARRHLPGWLALNGYATQAGAISRGGTMYGIGSPGTVDYGRVAVLGRITPTLADRFVVQIANRRVGASPTEQYQPDVKVDWLFYEHEFGDGTRVRAGRIPLPFGIYNETRYVGTLLPFYRAPASVYREKEFSTESADAALVAREFALPAGYAVELTAYAGQLDYVEASSLPWLPPGTPGAPPGEPPTPPANGWTYATAPARARAAIGTQAWVTTPVPGLRAGVGALRTKLSGGLFHPDGRVDGAYLYTASVDGSFDRITVRAERLVAGMGPSVRMAGAYVQLGARVAGPLAAYVQADFSHARIADLPVPPAYTPQTLNLMLNRDQAASAVWTFRPGLQLRGEYHRTLGYNADEAVPLNGPARRGGHAILSVSAAY